MCKCTGKDSIICACERKNVEVWPPNPKPHKHTALIKAWADGAEVEFRLGKTHPWAGISNPQWHLDREYRIKPVPKPDRRGPLRLDTTEMSKTCFIECGYGVQPNFVAVFDGETGKLKSVSLL